MLKIFLDYVKLKDNEEKILENIEFNSSKGKLNIIMGTNGIGKSSFFKSIFKHPDYFCEGKISIENNDYDLDKITTLDLINNKMSLVLQNSPEIEGLKLGNLCLSLGKKFIGKQSEYRKKLDLLLDELNLKKEFLKREIVNFSGGERKKIELLLSLIQNPDYFFIDEIDSGLDLDSLKLISKKLTNLLIDENKSLNLITHNFTIIENMISNNSKVKELINVYVMKDKSFVKVSDYSLLEEIKINGYSSINKFN